MPNTLAYLVLFGWPLVMVVLFSRLPIERAVIWSMLGAFLIVPSGTAMDLPLIPPLDKDTLPNLTAFVLCLSVMLQRRELLPRSPMLRFLLILFVVSPIVSALTNPERLVYGPTSFVGMKLYDGFSDLMRQSLMILPFLVGRAILVSEEARRDLLRALVIGGLVYSLPMLIEVRLSPQINIWVYGYFPHNFAQQMRFGGFRPVVFLSHGLWVAMYAAMAVMAATALWRHGRDGARGGYGMAMLWLSAVLITCKSVAPIMYALIAFPLLRFFTLRRQLTVAAILAAIVVTYPVLRANQFIPVDAMVERAYAFNPERGQSLEFRFDNEEILLEHAAKKPLAGWGLFGRHRVFDPDTGEDLSVTDGTWIIVLGTSGWLGYIATFGLLTIPMLMLWARRARIPPGTGELAGALSIIQALVLVNLLPNSFLPPLTWLIAGALLGYAESLKPREAEKPQREFDYARKHRQGQEALGRTGVRDPAE